ncbi:hypothetical protein CYMTET_52261 [Cymbomonas tetramitiformis]|uniref:Uncharacterized protein n=1 Tax=Cymbomonas tetramitiformis TaxID=36881 RepID=A0AAE0BJD8_9CHLO|nr:hypothetical protein CYMTET_52261 [Cymbomonas tetramitiformis]
MRPLTISPHELRDNGLACGTRCVYAACCPTAAYYGLRNQVDVYVTRDTPAAEMQETRRVLALIGAALTMCNPIASHWLHVHERQRNALPDLQTLEFTLLDLTDNERVDRPYDLGDVAFFINRKYVVRNFTDLRRFYTSTPRKGGIRELLMYSVLDSPFRHFEVAIRVCRHVATPYHVPKPAHCNYSRHHQLRLARADMRAMRKYPPHAVLLKLAEMRHARMAAYVKRNREKTQNSQSRIEQA